MTGEICREARGTGGVTGRSIFERDPADGHYRDGNSPANFAQPIKSLRRTVSGFGRSGEDGTKKKIISAAICSGFGRPQKVAGSTDQEILLMTAGVHKPLRFLYRQTLLAEMHAAGALRQRNVQTIVDENPCWRSVAGCCACRQL
jgi:hypothetical protein